MASPKEFRYRIQRLRFRPAARYITLYLPTGKVLSLTVTMKGLPFTSIRLLCCRLLRAAAVLVEEEEDLAAVNRRPERIVLRGAAPLTIRTSFREGRPWLRQARRIRTRWRRSPSNSLCLKCGPALC